MATDAKLVLQTVEGPGLRFTGSVESGATIELDGGAGGRSASPVEAVLIALGGCSGADVISILRKKRQNVLGYEVVLRGERRATHPRSFTRIEVVHRIRGRNLSATAIQDAIRLSDTTYCSVHAMLAPGAEITSRFEIVPA
jgi:putative redox protein